MMTATAWLKDFCDRNGDKMPDRATINLPSSMTVFSIYEEYKTVIGDAISKSSFYRLWISDFADYVKIPPVSLINRLKMFYILIELLVTEWVLNQLKICFFKKTHMNLYDVI